ncbi:encapsulin [Lactobacillus amylovorus]|uniref:encapsulin n=1 Tax=Lactobacillus amylovorus TaxID=1604 RepID=UPI0023304FDE|nr:encapsulin [Lactobacillus amylovorus]MDB6265348.1 encapsulin [Lactobacillus amylovorus]
MANTAMITKRDLIDLDKKVYSPAHVELNGRKFFRSFPIGRYQEYYAYDVYEATGKARRSGSRNTDTPVGDETKHRYFAPVTQFEYGIEYTDDELGRAQEVKDTGFVSRRGDQAARAMAEYEDKVIFNGIKEDNIIGLTNKKDDTGFQYEAAPKTLDQMTNEEMLHYFKAVSHKITDLHYSSDKPILAITDAVETILDTPFNEYNADKTVEDMIGKYFSQIKVIPELESKYTGRSLDMGLAFLNDADTASIGDAMPVQRTLFQHLDERYKIKYKERFTGVIVRYPSHFVTLDKLCKTNGTGDNDQDNN